jgi:hypothetical protein
MASIEDKILNGPRENYCSSDEGEEGDDEGPSSGLSSKTLGTSQNVNPVASGIPPAQGSKWGGYSVNTGPKGVLRDWELYKEQEEALRQIKAAELIQMVKDSSITCRTEAEDSAAAAVVDKIAEEIGQSDDLDELLMSDSVLEEFVKQRMSQMIRSGQQQSSSSASLVEIRDGEEFLHMVDASPERTSVVIHIYDEKRGECGRMNEALETLAGSGTLASNVQLCKMRADAAGLSGHFKAKGVPALLVYKGGSLIGNFVQMKDELGPDFSSGDVENFLIEHGMITDTNDIPALIAKAKERLRDKN